MALKRINLNLDEELLAQLDAYASSMYVSRSAALSMFLSNFFMERKAVNTMDKMIDVLKATGKLPVDESADKP